MHHSSVNKGHDRFFELDGLRALAVVSVILFHCEIPGFFDAGFLGVDMFFAISGFIITAILIKGYNENGNFRFPTFYFRRLKRLLPPVFTLLLLAALTAFISESAFAAFKADVGAGLAYVSNWWQIYAKQPYFDTTPHVLKHLWSLAVEEQFYFVWPPVAFLALKKFGQKGTGVLALGLALLSTGWMWYLYDPNVDAADQYRIYLGTDTHAMGLLAGAALACFWNPWKEPADSIILRWLWRLAAVLSLAAIGYMIYVLNPGTPELYRGGFLLMPLLTGVVAYCTMSDRSFIVSRLLQTRIVQWLGTRSYSLYLVHWLVFVWLRLLGFEDFSQPAVLGMALGLTAFFSECMYRWVELPSRDFNPRKLADRTMVVCVVSYTAAAWTIFLMTAPAPVQEVPELVEAPAPDAADENNRAPVAALPAPAAAGPVAQVPEEPSGPDEVISGGEDIFAIGDSVLLGAKVHLAKTIPGIRIDASVGRQASQGLKVVKEWRGHSGKASTILLHLGTNGYINEAQFRELLGELADRKAVIVINVHASRRWAEPNNAMIARLAPEFPNVKVIDWNALSANRPDFFVKDGIHLTSKGMRALTGQIKQATGGTVIVPVAESDTMLADGNSPRTPKGAAKEAETKESAAGTQAGKDTAEPVAKGAAKGGGADGAPRQASEHKGEGKADDKAEHAPTPAAAGNGAEHASGSASGPAHDAASATAPATAPGTASGTAPRTAPAPLELPQLN